MEATIGAFVLFFLVIIGLFIGLFHTTDPTKVANLLWALIAFLVVEFGVGAALILQFD
jgi:hypothetical protein